MLNSSPPNSRLATVLVYFLTVLTILQLFKLQVIDYKKYSTLAQSQIKTLDTLVTKRGTIYTKDGVVLSADSPSWSVIVSVTNPVDMELFLKQKNAIVEFLVSHLGAERSVIEEKLPKEPTYESIKNLSKEEKLIRLENVTPPITYKTLIKDISQREKEALEKKRFPGIYTKEYIKRIYPNGRLASHIIGFVGQDSNGNPIGQYGLEGFFWGDIKGKMGMSEREKDLLGNAILSKEYENITFRQGKNISITINAGIQKKVEQKLEESVRDFSADSGTAVLMDPKTGAIIAMANYPDYDPNFYYNVKDTKVYKNKAVGDIYEYGSVQKPLTIAMAINEGLITKDTICNDTGELKVLDKKIYNYDFRKYGKITPKDVLKNSVNVCTAQFGLKIGPEKMSEYLKKLGIGQVVGIGLEDEEVAFLKSPEKWIETDTATISFGQTVSASSLQVLSALSTIANNGKRMQPYLVDRIYNNEEVIKIEPQEVGQIFTEETSKEVASMMEYAIMSQPYLAKYRGSYKIAGKTGTAQVAKPTGGYYEDRVIVTFVGFSPTKDAKMIMLVRVENPRRSTIASASALPVWLNIFDAIKDDLGINRK